METVCVLLATYQGEKYLKSLLDSIMRQSYRDFILCISDDASTDTTLSILGDYHSMYPQKIFITMNVSPSGSAKANFFKLIHNMPPNVEYFMFCDQDDVWAADKIQMTMDAMRLLEKGKHCRMPLLVHTDMVVTDNHMHVIAPSFIRYQRLKPQCQNLEHLLVQNNITGCTVMVNRSLLDMCIIEDIAPILMHDWWLGLVASAFGDIRFLENQTVKYRQHGLNQVGAKNVMDFTYIKTQIKSKLKNRLKYSLTSAQAKAFLNAYDNHLTQSQKEMLTAYIAMPNDSKLNRCLTVIRYGFYMQGFARKVAQFIFG
jgi:glycosyltransferase involved in cell wall biosynthesis